MPEHQTPAELASVSVADLRRAVLPSHVPQQEQYRTYYGRSLDMARIENAIRQAEHGVMVYLTDLEGESLSIDPHVNSCATKRFGGIQALDWTLTPASGPDIDKGLATELCDLTRANLERIPCFGERLYDMAWAEFDGRAAQEIHWDYRAGRDPWWIRELGWIHPRRLSFDQERNLVVIDTTAPPSDFIPRGERLVDHPAKFWWWCPRLFREYPEREGLGPRSLYWMYFKRFSWRHRMVLTEVFGLPWRIVTIDDTVDEKVSGDVLDEVSAEVENLGRDTTAQIPKGVKLEVLYPHHDSGNLFGMTNEDVDKQMSKLWLGNTGTTETDQGNRAGMIIARGEQDIIYCRLGEGLSGRVQEKLVLPITVLNRGASVANHAPQFHILTDPPRDRDKDMGIIERAVQLQVPVAISEVREVTGTREPDEEEPYLVGTPGGTDAMGNPTPGGVRVVDPKATLDDPDARARRLPHAEEGGTAAAADNADEEADKDPLAAQRRSLVAWIKARTGLTHELAARAFDAAAAGRADELHRVPGLGSDDARAILEAVPIPIVVPLQGLRDLARLKGLELTDDALRALEGMGPEVRESVVEELLTNARLRPLDP